MKAAEAAGDYRAAGDQAWNTAFAAAAAIEGGIGAKNLVKADATALADVGKATIARSGVPVLGVGAGGAGVVFVKVGAATPADPLVGLAREMHSALRSRWPQWKSVTAVLETEEGITLVGRGRADLSREQIALAKSKGLVSVILKGEDAEITVIQGAAATPDADAWRDLRGAKGSVCAGCRAHIEQISGTFPDTAAAPADAPAVPAADAPPDTAGGE